jgi:hypothetical protein
LPFYVSKKDTINTVEIRISVVYFVAKISLINQGNPLLIQLRAIQAAEETKTGFGAQS